MREPKMELVKPGKSIESFMSVKEKVLKLVEEKPCVKGSYLMLWCYYLRRYHGVKFPDRFFEDKRWHEIPSTETVGRAFRKLKEQGYVDQTMQRKLNREIVRREYRYSMPQIR